MNITHGRALKILSGNDEMERGLKISSFIQELTAVEPSPPNIFFSSREIIISGLTCPPHCEHHTDNTQQLLHHCFPSSHNTDNTTMLLYITTTTMRPQKKHSKARFKISLCYKLLAVTGWQGMASVKGISYTIHLKRNQQPILLNCNVWLTLKQHYFFL